MFDKGISLFFACIGLGMMILSIGFITGEWSPFYGMSDWMRYGGGIIGIGFSGIIMFTAIDMFNWKVK